ncbi:hypothetical protein ACFQH6_15925 [Halobacteriaceae archaeon GCM10025711]
MDRRIAVATLLVATGVGLAANPVYLDWLLPYTPAQDAWRLTGLYYATLGLVGLVTLALGGFTLVRGWRLSVGHAVSLALAVLVLFPTYLSVGSWLVRTVRGPDVYVISLTAPLGDLFGEGLFAVVALALFFPLGVAVARRDLLAVSGLLTALVGSYVVVSLATGSPLVVLLPWCSSRPAPTSSVSRSSASSSCSARSSSASRTPH